MDSSQNDPTFRHFSTEIKIKAISFLISVVSWPSYVMLRALRSYNFNINQTLVPVFDRINFYSVFILKTRESRK